MDNIKLIKEKFEQYATDAERINYIVSNEIKKLDLLEDYGYIHMDWSQTYDKMINWFCEENGIEEEEKNQLKEEDVFEEIYSYDYFDMTIDEAFFTLMQEEYDKLIADVKEDGVALIKDVWDQIRSACERNRYSIDGLFGEVHGIEWEISVYYLIVDDIDEIKIPQFKYDVNDKKIHILNISEDEEFEKGIYRILIDRKYGW